MYKRRHWRDLHGDNSSGSSSDEDSESEITASEDEEADSQELSSESASDNEGSQELEANDAGAADGSDHDQQDDDIESEGGSSDAEDLTADHVIKAWTSSDPEAQNFKGMPLRCKACSAMLLNRAAYLTHMSSKKHLRKVEALPASKKDKPLLVLAGTEEEEVETHTERLERIQRELAELQEQKKKQSKQAKKATAQPKVKTAQPVDEKTGAKNKEQSTTAGKADKASKGKAVEAAAAAAAAAAAGGQKAVGAKNEKQPRDLSKPPADKPVKRAKLAVQRADSDSDSDDDEQQQQQQAKKGQKGQKPDRIRPGKRERAELKAQLGEDASKDGKRKKQRISGKQAGQDSNGTEGSQGTYMNSKARRTAAREAARQQAT